MIKKKIRTDRKKIRSNISEMFVRILNQIISINTPIFSEDLFTSDDALTTL